MSALRELSNCALRDRLAIARRRHVLNRHLSDLPEMREVCERANRELKELVREARRRGLDQPPAAGSLSSAPPTKTVNRFPPQTLAPTHTPERVDPLALRWEALRLARKGKAPKFKRLFSQLAREFSQLPLPSLDP